MSELSEICGQLALCYLIVYVFFSSNTKVNRFLYRFIILSHLMSFLYLLCIARYHHLELKQS